MSLADRIAELEQLLDTCASDVSGDFGRTTFDLSMARKRLSELKAQAAGTTRPLAATINLSSGFDE